MQFWCLSKRYNLSKNYMKHYGYNFMSKKKTAFLIGTRWFGVLGPCQHIIHALNSEGYTVFVFGQEDAHYRRYFSGQCKLVKLRMKRSYFSPISDILDILKIISYLIRYQPLVVHSFNPKPALMSYASVCAYPSTNYFIGVTGLGNTFIRAPKLEGVITKFLRKACDRASYVFFQNNDDIDSFVERNIVSREKALLFIGPGVDLEVFYPKESQVEVDLYRVGCVARLIWQKGIKEFVEAAMLFQQRYPEVKVEFRLFGEIDEEHPDRIDPSYIKDAVHEKNISHVSWTESIADELRDLDVFILHSYREGAPRAILEASAVGLPTIGSDAIGVRELVIDGKTGYLTKLHDVEAIVQSIYNLYQDRELRRRMGRIARIEIGEKYSLKNASAAQLQMYKNMGLIHQSTISAL